MDISINEEHKDHTQRKIESDNYGSSDDVVGKALELLNSMTKNWSGNWLTYALKFNNARSKPMLANSLLEVTFLMD